MKGFRLKLAAILLSSELNKRKGSPHLNSDENTVSPRHCVTIENSKMLIKRAQKKRKHSDEAECLVV